MIGDRGTGVPSDGAGPLGLYLHVPFCASICHYCNFNRGLFDGVLKDRYVEAMDVEIRRAGDGGAADTIYFGGGTPSLLEPAEIGRLVHACREAFDVSADAEVTLETNPETATRDRLAAFREAGVTRISFGVQSFHDTELARLGRTHDAARARAAFADARSAGFDNISLDLMMWLPAQSVRDWQENVEALIALGPDHASLYLLELYPNAPLKEEMARAGWSQAPDEDAAEMYLWAMDRLARGGYAQYEISNVARPGRTSRHNLKYWTDGEWLGFGCGAHSTRAGVRWQNLSSTGEYVACVSGGASPAIEHRRLAPDEQVGEALFMGLRLLEGVDLAAIDRRYRTHVWAQYAAPLRPFLEGGFVQRDGDRLRLTRAGMLVANEVMQVFV